MTLPICTRNLVTEFQRIVLNENGNSDCNCPNNCEGILFDVRMDSSLLDANIECESDEMKNLAFSR